MAVIDKWINKIEDEFFDLPIHALGEKGARKNLLQWRDSMASTPRAADLIMAVLSKIIAFAVDREDIPKHPLEKVEKLASSSRKDNIWSDAQVAAFKAKAPARMVLALELGYVAHAGVEILVPTLYGQEAVRRKAAEAPRHAGAGRLSGTAGPADHIVPRGRHRRRPRAGPSAGRRWGWVGARDLLDQVRQ